MSNRDTFNASQVTAASTKVATVAAAVTAAQETINASGCNVGYTLQTGNYANLLASLKAATIAKANTLFAAEHAKQVAINVARDTLRNGGGDNAAF